MAAKQIIWPTPDSGNKLVEVDNATYSVIKEYSRKFSKPDEIWEFARMIIALEKDARAREDRHARGDFSNELNNAEGYAHDVGDRLDGPPFTAAREIVDKINDCQASGFDSYDAERLQELHNKLVAEVHKTYEIAVKLGEAITELRGLV